MKNILLIIIAIINILPLSLTAQARTQKTILYEDIQFSYVLHLDSPEGKSIQETSYFEVIRKSDGKTIQRLPHVVTLLTESDLIFKSVDANFDGYLDFSFTRHVYNNAYLMQHWLYNPEKKRFEKDSLLSEFTNISFDPKHKTIYTYYRSGFYDYGHALYKWAVDSLLCIAKENTLVELDGIRYTSTIEWNENGVMRNQTAHLAPFTVYNNVNRLYRFLPEYANKLPGPDNPVRKTYQTEGDRFKCVIQADSFLNEHEEYIVIKSLSIHNKEGQTITLKATFNSAPFIASFIFITNPLIKVLDANFDGYEDVAVLSYTELTNSYYDYWIYEPKEKTFIRDLTLGHLSNLSFITHQKAVFSSFRESNLFNSINKYRLYQWKNKVLSLVVEEAYQASINETTMQQQTLGQVKWIEDKKVHTTQLINAKLPASDTEAREKLTNYLNK